MKTYSRYLIFFFTAFINTKILTIGSSQIFKKQHRSLPEIDINSLKEQLDEVVTPLNWISAVQSANTIMVQAKVSHKYTNFFELVVQEGAQEELNQNQYYLTISNHVNDLGNNKFDFLTNHRIYARSTVTKKSIEQKKFIESTVKKFREAYRQIVEINHIEEFYLNLKNLLENRFMESLVLVQRGTSHSSIVFDLLFKKDGSLFSQGVIYKIGPRYIAFALSFNDDSVYFNMSIDNLEGSNKDIIQILSDGVAKKDEKISIREIQQKVRSTIIDACPGAAPWIEGLADKPDFFYFKIHKSGQTNLANPTEQCPFIDSDIIVTKYNHGYMQYFHIFFDSMLLKEEFIIVTVRDKFEQSFTKAFGMIRSDSETARAELLKSTDEHELTLENLKKLLSIALKEEAIEKSFTNEELANCNNTGNKCLAKYEFPQGTVIAKVIVNSDGYLIRLIRTLPKSKIPFSIELSMPLKNSVDQKQSMILHIKKFMTES